MDGPILIQMVLVVMMVGVSIAGFKTVSPEHRFRMRFGGFSGPESTVSKRTALVIYPVLGAVVAWGTWLAGDEAGPQFGLLGVAGIGLLLLAQIWAVRSASR